MRRSFGSALEKQRVARDAGAGGRVDPDQGAARARAGRRWCAGPARAAARPPRSAASGRAHAAGRVPAGVAGVAVLARSPMKSEAAPSPPDMYRYPSAPNSRPPPVWSGTARRSPRPAPARARHDLAACLEPRDAPADHAAVAAGLVRARVRRSCPPCPTAAPCRRSRRRARSRRTRTAWPGSSGPRRSSSRPRSE